MSFTGGRLKLKGDDSGVKKKKRKKSKAEDESKALQLVEEGTAKESVVKETKDGYFLENNDATDRRTAAEKRHDEMMAKRENERVAKAASKSHRERVNEFNAYLQNLSEHHDIPRVGPG